MTNFLRITGDLLRLGVHASEDVQLPCKETRQWYFSHITQGRDLEVEDFYWWHWSSWHRQRKRELSPLQLPWYCQDAFLGPCPVAIYFLVFIIFTFVSRSLQFAEIWSGITSSSFMMFWNNSSLNNYNEKVLLIISVIRRKSCNHFVEKNSK